MLSWKFGCAVCVCVGVVRWVGFVISEKQSVSSLGRNWTSQPVCCCSRSLHEGS